MVTQHAALLHSLRRPLRGLGLTVSLRERVGLAIERRRRITARTRPRRAWPFREPHRSSAGGRGSASGRAGTPKAAPANDARVTIPPAARSANGTARQSAIFRAGFAARVLEQVRVLAFGALATLAISDFRAFVREARPSAGQRSRQRTRLRVCVRSQHARHVRAREAGRAGGRGGRAHLQERGQGGALGPRREDRSAAISARARLDRALRRNARHPGARPVYVVSNPHLNAATYGTNEDAFILVNSALMDHFSDSELLSVLGHECGHIHNNHVVYLTALHYLTNVAGILLRNLAVPALLTLRAWSRRAEVTCDRAGALCAGELEPVAARADQARARLAEAVRGAQYRGVSRAERGSQAERRPVLVKSSPAIRGCRNVCSRCRRSPRASCFGGTPRSGPGASA